MIPAKNILTHPQTVTKTMHVIATHLHKSNRHGKCVVTTESKHDISCTATDLLKLGNSVPFISVIGSSCFFPLVRSVDLREATMSLEILTHISFPW